MKAIKNDLAEGPKRKKGVYANLDEINAATRHMNDEEADEWLDEKYGRFAMDDDRVGDSATNNVIKFKPKDTVH